MPNRLPQVKTLYDILPKGVEGGKEFARIVDLLLFHEARRAGKKTTLFSDASGDYHGLDSFEGDDPEFRSIFETCLWRPTAEEEAKLKKRGKKK